MTKDGESLGLPCGGPRLSHYQFDYYAFDAGPHEMRPVVRKSTFWLETRLTYLRSKPRNAHTHHGGWAGEPTLTPTRRRSRTPLGAIVERSSAGRRSPSAGIRADLAAVETEPQQNDCGEEKYQPRLKNEADDSAHDQARLNRNSIQLLPCTHFFLLHERNKNTIGGGRELCWTRQFREQDRRRNRI